MIINKKQFLDMNKNIRNLDIWQIEVDYNNLDDLQKLSNIIKSKIGEIKSKENGSKRQNKLLQFESCNKIYNSDITDLYKEMDLDLDSKYYVYAHCEPQEIAIEKNGITTWVSTLGLDLIPFYIGKGVGNRAFDLNRNETHRKIRQKYKTFGKDIQVRIIKDNLTELEALCLESKLIDIFGIMGKGGRLVNLDEGLKSKERQKIYSQELSNINNFYKNSLKVEV